MSLNIKDFLLRVLPWPGDATPGYVNVHISGPKSQGGRFWSGTPTRDIDYFLQAVHNYLGWSVKPDVYMCMSRQRITKPPDARGRIRAAKLTQDALAVKSIWLDMDVKAAPKGYANLGEALDALTDFVKAHNLPPPSALVASGGGLHVYWISEQEMSHGDWQPYAEGLKHLALQHGLRFDAGITADAARVLRVPGTWNCKTKPHRAVRLLHLAQSPDYDFPVALATLKGIAPVLSYKAPPTTVGSFFHLPGGMDPAYASLDTSEALSDGIERYEALPLDAFSMARQCPLFKNAFATGGTGYSQGLWNLTTLASTWLEDGHILAHKFANGHSGYTPAETEALWKRKLGERAGGRIGWPACSKFQQEGSVHCAGCQHLAKGKSPLHLAEIVRPAMATATPRAPIPVQSLATFTPDLSALSVTGAVTMSMLPDPQKVMLPPGYQVDAEGFICELVDKAKEGQPPDLSEVRLMSCSLYNPWAQKDPPALNFVTSTDLGNSRSVRLLQEHMYHPELYKQLLKQEVKPYPKHKARLEDFIMAWLTKLHQAQESTPSSPFGWYMVDGVRKGFVYGNSIMRDDKTTIPAGAGDQKTRSRYTPTGALQPWVDACKLITEQHRPGLEVIVAASFAAPLMAFTGEYSALISVCGQSGAGKTSASRVGLAVWGHPTVAKEGDTSTHKSVLHKMGELKNLPLYWDEVKDDKSQARAYDALFMSTLGAEGGRLNAQIQQQEKGSWQTLVVLCSNPSFADFVVGKNGSTTAGLVRVLEWEETKPPKGATGEVSTVIAGQILGDLDNNYGHMGLRYAKVLAENHERIKALCTENATWFDTQLTFTREERFWSALAGSILTGAQLGNLIGCSFHIDDIRAFLVRAIQNNRSRLTEEGVNGGTVEHTEEVLTAFLKSCTKETMLTDRIPFAHTGRPLGVSLLHRPMQGYPAQVQWAVSDNTLRFSKKAFYDWMRRPGCNLSPRQTWNGLKEYYGASTTRGSLGAGTNVITGNETLIVIPVLPRTPLYDLMTAYGEPADIQGAETPAIDQDSDTVARAILTGIVVEPEGAA